MDVLAVTKGGTPVEGARVRASRPDGHDIPGLETLTDSEGRAGLGEALGILGVIAGGSHLLAPPSAMAVGMVFAKAVSALGAAAGGTAAGAVAGTGAVAAGGAGAAVTSSAGWYARRVSKV